MTLRFLSALLFMLFGPTSIVVGPADAQSSPTATFDIGAAARSVIDLQTRLTAGDTSALTELKAVQSQISDNLRKTDQTSLLQKSNLPYFALIALSGGDASRIRDLFAKASIPQAHSKFYDAVFAFLEKRSEKTTSDLLTVRHDVVPSLLSAAVELSLGQALAPSNARAALALLREARLDGPGTLFEESALRRTVIISIEQGLEAEAMSSIRDLLRRFPRSLYLQSLIEAAAEAALPTMFSDVSIARQLNQAGLGTAEHWMDLALSVARERLLAGRLEPARALLTSISSIPMSERQGARFSGLNAAANIALLPSAEFLSGIKNLEQSSNAPRDVRLMSEAIEFRKTLVNVPVPATTAKATNVTDEREPFSASEVLQRAKKSLDVADRVFRGQTYDVPHNSKPQGR